MGRGYLEREREGGGGGYIDRVRDTCRLIQIPLPDRSLKLRTHSFKTSFHIEKKKLG